MIKMHSHTTLNIGIEFSFWKCRVSYEGNKREQLRILHMMYVRSFLGVNLRDRTANRKARDVLQAVIYAG
jgi:hypothetical protein